MPGLSAGVEHAREHWEEERRGERARKHEEELVTFLDTIALLSA